MQTTPKLGMVIPSGDGDPFDEIPFVTALLKLDDVVAARIAGMTLAAPAGSFDFTNIPAVYSALLLVAHLRGDNPSAAAAALVRFNNDTGPNYQYELLTATTSTITAAFAGSTTVARIGDVSANTSVAGYAGPAMLVVPGYASTTFSKPALGFAYDPHDGALVYSGSLWANAAAAVNRVTLFPGAGNWLAGSRATLYGLG